MPEIRPATDAELPAVGRALAAAFADDPVWSWIAPAPDSWSHRAAAWFTTEARLQHRGHGEVLTDAEVRGAAIWSPPERWKVDTRDSLPLLVPSLRLFRHRAPRAVRMLTAVERLHPTDPPHWYLAILGTDPAHQGAGVGSALIRAVLDRCDAEGLPAYLESSKERNVPFYARHGFEVREQLDLSGGPTMWTMWREPRG